MIHTLEDFNGRAVVIDFIGADNDEQWLVVEYVLYTTLGVPISIKAEGKGIFYNWHSIKSIRLAAQ